MAFLSKYGTARHIYVPIPKAGSANHAASGDWTPAAGDVKISKDGGAAANVTNLPTAIAMGNSTVWDFSLTATEMQAAQVIITVADSATKAVDDTGFIIETYGNASGQHAFDLGTASSAQTGDSYARLGAPAGASVSADISTVASYIDTEVAAIKAKTDNLPASPAATSDVPSAATVASAVVAKTLTESYAADGAAPTLEQCLFLIQQLLAEKSVAGTTMTVKKLDGSTTAATFTLNDASTPTSITRTT